MTTRITAVFDLRPLYDELVHFFDPSREGVAQALTCSIIAYLFESECYCDFSDDVNAWYLPVRCVIKGMQLTHVRALFHRCIDYFFLLKLSHCPVYLAFYGNNVIVSNAPISPPLASHRP